MMPPNVFQCTGRGKGGKILLPCLAPLTRPTDRPRRRRRGPPKIAPLPAQVRIEERGGDARFPPSLLPPTYPRIGSQSDGGEGGDCVSVPVPV